MNCFFCGERRATLKLISLTLPPPHTFDEPVPMCDQCAKLPSEEKVELLLAKVTQ